MTNTTETRSYGGRWPSPAGNVRNGSKIPAPADSVRNGWNHP